MSTFRGHAVRLIRWFWRSIVGIAIVVVAAGSVAVGWARQVTAADAGASAGLDSRSDVTVSRSDWFVFRPKDEAADVGLIFYPGGKADPLAYAPILRALAARGYFVVMTPMPLNLAILAPDRATQVMQRFPQVTRWVIGGHSVGGVAAAAFASAHAGQLAGVLLWAAYPAPFNDLSRSGLPVLSVSGSADEVTRPAAIGQARALLPANATLAVIAGGDHWNFGHFRGVRGTATISRAVQQSQVVDASARFLGLASRPPVGPGAPIQ